MLGVYRDQAEVSAASAKLGYGEELEQDRQIGTVPADGILVHGLYMDGFRWDDEKAVVAYSLPGVMNSPLPLMHMEPKMDFEAGQEEYRAPLYKTATRAGVLSTTGLHDLATLKEGPPPKRNSIRTVSVYYTQRQSL